MIKRIVLITTVLTALVIAISCETPEQFPDTPEVSFQSFVFKDTVDILGNEIKRCYLTIKCIDGDWDVGLSETDTTGVFHRDSLYYNNFFINLFAKVNGEFKEITVAVGNYRVPYIKPPTHNKTYKAEIKVKLEYTQKLFPYDTIQYKFYLVDKKLHRSNVVLTPVISLVPPVDPVNPK